MPRGRIFISASLFLLFLFVSPSYLWCQEKVNNRVQASKHYQKGRELYNQGEYGEATAEFDKAAQLLKSPEIKFMEDTQQQANKAISPVNTVSTLPQRPNKADDQEYFSTAAYEQEEVEYASLVSQEPAESEYYIDIGDVLDVSVWQMADLSRSDIIVRPDGKISVPLIGDIKAQGLTLTQLDSIVTEKLKAYVKSPEVSVMVRSFGEQANKVIALGEINSPGVYQFRSSPTIMDVVASAGGYTKYAVLNSIVVIRGNVMKKPNLMRVDIASILKSGKLSENIVLKPNDIVYVPRSFIGKLNTLMEVLQPAYSEYMQTLSARQLSRALHQKSGI